MPLNNPQHWTYEQFVEQADEVTNDVRARLIGELRNAANTRTATPSRVSIIGGIGNLADTERRLSQNVYMDEGASIFPRRSTSAGYADYLANRKGIYQFIKDTPQAVDRDAMRRNYTAMCALRLQASGISRAARMYGASRLAEMARETVAAFREDYRRASWVPPTGYTVVRWFEDRKIEFHLPPLEQASRTRAEQWALITSQFREAIKRAREERRAFVDVLANKTPNMRLQKNALKLLRVYKKPDENVRSVGIEIECFMPRNADMTLLYPVAQYVNVGSDGSIRPDGNNMAGVEFRVCAPAYKMEEVITTLCKILKTMGAKVNSSCGLHVHLDQRNRTPEDVKQTFANFIRAQNLLFEVVPSSRRENNFCKKHRGTDFEQATRGQRYKAINASAFRKHRTIEIRLFNGTVNATKIINWVKTLWAIESGSPVLRCPKTFDIAQRYWRIDADTLRWLKARQEKFKTVTATDNTDVMDVEPIEEN